MTTAGYRKQASLLRWEGWYQKTFPVYPFSEAGDLNTEEYRDLFGEQGLAGTIDIMWYKYEPKACCFTSSQDGQCPTCDIWTCDYLSIYFSDACCIPCGQDPWPGDGPPEAYGACCGQNEPGDPWECFENIERCHCDQANGIWMGQESECECEAAYPDCSTYAYETSCPEESQPGSCCLSPYECIDVDSPADCSGEFIANWTCNVVQGECSCGYTFPSVGRCCHTSTETCEVMCQDGLTSAECHDLDWHGFGVSWHSCESCSSSPCDSAVAARGACCVPFDDPSADYCGCSVCLEDMNICECMDAASGMGSSGNGSIRVDYTCAQAQGAGWCCCCCSCWDNSNCCCVGCCPTDYREGRYEALRLARGVDHKFGGLAAADKSITYSEAYSYDTTAFTRDPSAIVGASGEHETRYLVPCDPEDCDIGGQCSPCGFMLYPEDAGIHTHCTCKQLFDCECAREASGGGDDTPDCQTEECNNQRKLDCFKDGIRCNIVSGHGGGQIPGCDDSWCRYDECEAHAREYSIEEGAQMCDNQVGPYYLKCGENGYNTCEQRQCADECRCYGSNNLYEGTFTCNMCDSEHYGAVAASFGRTESVDCVKSWEDGPAGPACEGGQEDYGCCTHSGVIGEEFGCNCTSPDEDTGGASTSCLWSYTYSCVFDPYWYSDSGYLQILNKEAYRLHGIECCGFNTSNIQGDLLFGSGDGDNAGNTGFADEICEECETPVGGCCITIAGDELAKLSQNAKVFLSTAWGSGEYECNLQGYWGDYSPESSSMPVDGATPDFSQKSALTFNPFSKTCIVESVSYHIQTLLDEANLVLSNFGGGALAALNLTQYQAMAVATAYYDAIINYNFMSRIRGYKSSGVVPNANEKNRATIIDYSTAVELPVYLTYINQRADRISALLGILLGLESSGGPSTMPKAWDYNIETGEECDISEAMSSELYPKCLKNGEPIPPSPACHDICGRPADAPDFTIGDFIDTHGSNPSGGETMFYYPPMDEECLPAVPWHDPCQGGYDGGWEDVPSIFVAVVAFPELGDCLHADDIQQILENCNAEYYFASGNIRDTASAGGFSSVFDYLKSIGERQRRANSSPIQR